MRTGTRCWPAFWPPVLWSQCKPVPVLRQPFSILLALGLMLMLFARPAGADGDHGRRAGAEIRVLLGDIRRLRTEKSLSAARQKGLIARLYGGLSGLAILLRLADAEAARAPAGPGPDMAALTKLLQSNDLTGLAARLTALAARYPLIMGNASAGAARAKAIHEEFCAACHDDPDRDVARPAFRFKDMAATQSALEFYARMLTGVRAEKSTGFANPLTPAEINALMAWYKDAR